MGPSLSKLWSDRSMDNTTDIRQLSTILQASHTHTPRDAAEHLTKCLMLEKKRVKEIQRIVWWFQTKRLIILLLVRTQCFRLYRMVALRDTFAYRFSIHGACTHKHTYTRPFSFISVSFSPYRRLGQECRTRRRHKPPNDCWGK
jgi:hypothetical protein